MVKHSALTRKNRDRYPGALPVFQPTNGDSNGVTLKPGVHTQFLTNTDETGRFIVHSKRTGRTYYIEPILSARTPKWGSIDPATGNLMNKKGHDKYTGAVTESESLITTENGFKNIEMLEPGLSPLAVIEYRDSKYPSI